MKIKFQVNKALVPMKAHYFLWNAGLAPVVPYLPLYARQLGFSSVIVGTIYTILPIVGMIVKPVFGAIADRFHCQKIVFLIGQLLAAAAFLSVFYVPKVPNETLVNFFRPDSEAVSRVEDGIEIDTKMLGNRSKNILTTYKMNDPDVYGTYQFWVFLSLMMIAWIGQALTGSTGDAICFEMLGDKPNRYGYQRMYGALGWGVVSLLTGLIVDQFSKGKSNTDYTASFYLAAGFLVLDFCVSSTLKYNQTKISTNILKDVGKLLLNMKIVVFVLWCLCMGMCTALIWHFLLWLVEDLANARGETRIKTLQGVLMSVQTLGGELPFFFLSGKILKKIGHVCAMSLVLCTVGIRFILYSVIENPWWFIPIELSNGLTFGLFYSCMASYASIVAPPGTEATMQGMVGAVFEGVGGSLGSYLAGLALSKVSSPMTFRYFGIGALSMCTIHIITQYFIQVKGTKPEQEPVERTDVYYTESNDSVNNTENNTRII